MSGSLPVTRIKVEDGLVHVARMQDVEDIIDVNKAMQNEPQKRAGTFRHIASIPNVILERWMNETGVNLFALPKDEFARFVKCKLDGDYGYLKTAPGRI